MKREPKESYCYKILFLYKKGVRVSKIARIVRKAPDVVVGVTNGLWFVPKWLHPEIKALGFKICSCCKLRIVPIRPIRNTTLTKLCPICWKNNKDVVNKSIP